MKNKEIYDISTLGITPHFTATKEPNNYQPFNYELKYKELLNLAVNQQKEIEQLKNTQKQIIANFNILAEVINGKDKTKLGE